MDRAPIFIGGPNRSGTSLLYALVSTHPNISMVQRTDMWRYFYGQYGDLSQAENFERCLEAMIHYRRLARLAPDPDRIRREFWEGKPTYGRLFALFHQHHAERIGRSRWGDKSLHTEHYADDVFAEFPMAKMIHVMRDPRDRYASERRKFTSSVASATSKWLSSARAAMRNSQRYPGRYMVVRYEALASHPEEVLRNVCDFIEEEYTAVMLTMKGAPEHLEQGGDSSFEQYEPGEISTRSIGRFTKVLSDREIALIQLFAGKEMANFDYQIHPVRLSASEKLSFYLGMVPEGAARMALWFALHTYRNVKGREVREHRVIEEYQPIAEAK